MKGYEVDGLPGRWLAAVARRVLSARVLETIFLPVLADMQHEWSERHSASARERGWIRFRGYLAFGETLALYVMAWPVRHLRENWLGDDAPAPRLLGRLAPPLVLLWIAATFILVSSGPASASFRARSLDAQARLVALALPFLSVATFPLAFLLGVVLALPGRARDVRAPGGSAGRPSGVLSLSLLAACFTLALTAWITPPANQLYRETLVRVLHPERPVRPLPKGGAEMSLGELSEKARLLRSGAEIARDCRGIDVLRAARLEAEWHKRLALPAATLLFGSLAFALAQSGIRKWVAAGIALLVYNGYFAFFSLGEQAAGGGSLPPALAMWSANAALGLSGLLVWWRSSQALPNNWTIDRTDAKAP